MGQIRLGQPVNRRLGDLLVAEGLVKQEQLQRALAEQKGTTEKLGSVLVRLKLVNEEQLTGFLSRQYGIPSITLSQLDIDPGILRLVPPQIARKYEVLPVKRAANTLTLAMADPTNVFALDDVSFMTNLQVLPSSRPRRPSGGRSSATTRTRAPPSRRCSPSWRRTRSATSRWWTTTRIAAARSTSSS